MSTTTTTDPTPPTRTARARPRPPAGRSRPPRRTMLAEGPAFARLVGFVGLFVLVLGAVVVITTRAARPAVDRPKGGASCSPRSAWP